MFRHWSDNNGPPEVAAKDKMDGMTIKIGDPSEYSTMPGTRMNSGRGSLAMAGSMNMN